MCKNELPDYLQKVFDNNGIKVGFPTKDYISLSWTSAAGEDCLVEVERDSIAESVARYAKLFSPARHVEAWNSCRRSDNEDIPEPAVLMEDAVDISRFMNHVADELIKAEAGHSPAN